MFDWIDKYFWVFLCLAGIYIGGHLVVYVVKSLF